MKLFGRREKKTENDFEKIMKENKKLLDAVMDFDKKLEKEGKEK